MWASTDTLLVNRYDEPFRGRVIAALREGLPGVKIVEVAPGYSDETWKGFASAYGLNVNSTVTNNCIYVPVYGTATDTAFLETLKQNTDKEIIGVNAKDVCRMGGSVRCLSWQLTADNARKLIAARSRAESNPEMISAKR